MLEPKTDVTNTSEGSFSRPFNGIFCQSPENASIEPKRQSARLATPLRALDLFCGAGGATRGLQRAGFHVTGVDNRPQPRYCGDEFIQRDALTMKPWRMVVYDFIWASPPCQAYTAAQRIRNNDHPDFVVPVRKMLRASGNLFVIENVVGAPLQKPIMLCGPMFGLRTYRHRLFECSFSVSQPWHEPHVDPQAKMGRRPKADEFIQVVGNFSGVPAGREAMGIEWMTRDELREAIPPAYSEFIGRAAIAQIKATRAPQARAG
jgi:DNA (cytosine-5)-methyltransferase 1